MRNFFSFFCPNPDVFLTNIFKFELTINWTKFERKNYFLSLLNGGHLMVFWEREMYFLSLILKIFQDFLNLKMLWIAWKSLLKVSSQFRGLFFWAKIYLKKSPATQPNHQIFPTPQNHKIISKFTRKKIEKVSHNSHFHRFPPARFNAKKWSFSAQYSVLFRKFIGGFFFQFFYWSQIWKNFIFSGGGKQQQKKFFLIEWKFE